MKNIVIRECYDTIRIGRDNSPDMLTDAEANELNLYLIKNEFDASNFKWSPSGLQITNYVGFIQLSTVAIEILPKVSVLPMEKSREVLLNILIQSGYLDVDYSTVSALKHVKKSLFEIFGFLFATKLRAEISKGMYLNYVRREENLAFIKGKLLLPGQARNIMQANGHAYCQYDDFSPDNLLNQIFKYVISFLITRVQTLSTLEILKFCLAHFAQVSYIQPTSEDTAKVLFDKTNQRFYPAFVIAKMFIRKVSSAMSAGRNKSFSILFEMNQLFESYISSIAVRSLTAQVRLQHSKHKLLVNEETGKGVYSLRPDIVIGQENSKQLIIDTKWKRISDSYFRYGVSREDYFQMYAYLTRYALCNAVILLYPYNSSIGAGSGAMLESYHLEGNPNKLLRVYSIDWESTQRTIEDIRKIVKENYEG